MNVDESLPLSERVRIRLRNRLTGALREQRAISEAYGAFKLIQGLALPDRARRLSSLLVAARFVQSQRLRRILGGSLEPYLTGKHAGLARRREVGWGRYRGDFGDLAKREALTATIVLKEHRGEERGVIYSSFEYNWMRLLAHHDAEAILRRYYLVMATSWSPTDYAVLAGFSGLDGLPLLVGVSNPRDSRHLEVLGPLIKPVEILASDWVDPRLFQPRATEERDIDILMVANWSRFKRHWLLFKALRGMPKDLSVVLVGRNAAGRGADAIRREAAAYGVEQDLELLTDIPIETVAALFSRAKVSTILSHREGSCVAVAESMMAGTPVVMTNDSHIGSKKYINPATGLLVPPRELGSALGSVLADPAAFRPREWGEGRIDCVTTTRKLNGLLKSHASSLGHPWTEDIVPMCWRPHPTYYHSGDGERFSTEEALLQSDFGLRIAKHPYK